MKLFYTLLLTSVLARRGRKIRPPKSPAEREIEINFYESTDTDPIQLVNLKNELDIPDNVYDLQITLSGEAKSFLKFVF